MAVQTVRAKFTPAVEQTAPIDLRSFTPKSEPFDVDIILLEKADGGILCSARSEQLQGNSAMYGELETQGKKYRVSNEIKYFGSPNFDLQITGILKA